MKWWNSLTDIDRLGIQTIIMLSIATIAIVVVGIITKH